MGGSVRWKSNGCILSPSVASVRLAEDVYLRCVKGGGEEEEEEEEERRREKKAGGGGIKQRAS